MDPTANPKRKRRQWGSSRNHSRELFVADVLEVICEFLHRDATLVAAANVCRVWFSRINELSCWPHGMCIARRTAAICSRETEIEFEFEADIVVRRIPGYSLRSSTSLKTLLEYRLRAAERQFTDDVHGYVALIRCRNGVMQELQSERRRGEVAVMHSRVAFSASETLLYFGLCATCAVSGWFAAQGGKDLNVVLQSVLACLSGTALSSVALLLWGRPLMTPTWYGCGMTAYGIMEVRASQEIQNAARLKFLTAL